MGGVQEHGRKPEVRKTNGEEYEPDCLTVLQASLDRVFREEGYS